MQDLRTEVPFSTTDQDYRLPPFNIENLKLPPPPPPPPKSLVSPNHFVKKQVTSPRKVIDNNESIDMELSEDENEENHDHRDNLKILNNADGISNNSSLIPPPPLPDLPDDVDANTFLDDLDNELNSNEFTANLQDPDNRINISQPPPRLTIPPHMTNVPPPNWPPKQQNNHMNYDYRRGGRNAHQNNHRMNQRNRGRGNFEYRGGNNFRGRGFGRGNYNKVNKARVGMRGNYQGAF